jgi:Domain of unknown function (DUF4173)
MMAGSRLSFALTGVGLAAAVLLVDRPVGLGALVVAVLMAAVVSLAHSAPMGIDSKMSGLLAVALIAMSVVITSTWVLMFDFLFALMLASHVVAGGKAFEEVSRSFFVVFIKLKAGAHLILKPFVTRLRGVSEGRTAVYARGSLVALVLVVVFGALFLSADRAFLELAGDLLVPQVDGSMMPARALTFVGVSLLGAGLIASAGYIESRGRNGLPDNPEAESQPERGSRIEWLIPLITLNALFVSFVTVQLAVLFGGRAHVLETTGLTYAQYARQGFFQLVAVALLTLAVVAGAIKWSRVDNDRERRLLRFLLELLCGLTLVVLASALKRLSLYEEVFGLTRLRISVHATILWLAGIFTMVIIAGLRCRTSWLPRAAMYFTGCGLLAFSLASPDAQIARQNVDRFEATGQLDADYLATLSQDAWPVLAELPEDRFHCMLVDAFERDEGLSPLSWNLSRQRASDALDDLSVGLGECVTSFSAQPSGD